MTKLIAWAKGAKKALTGTAIAVVGWGYVVVQSAPAQITSAEWVGLAAAILTGLGVYGVSNTA